MVTKIDDCRITYIIETHSRFMQPTINMDKPALHFKTTMDLTPT